MARTTVKDPAAVSLGKRGGSAKSPRKAKSSAANGKLGGYWQSTAGKLRKAEMDAGRSHG